MRYIVIIILGLFSLWSCKQHSNNTINENKEPQSKTANVNQIVLKKPVSDTINTREKTIKEWTFNKEKIYLFSSDESDEFYNYGYLKIGSINSDKFVRIPKEDSPYTGLEKMVIKHPFFTIEQSYRQGDYTNYEYITFKKEDQFIYLYKYAVDYTNIHNLEDDVEGLRLDQKAIGKVKMETVTPEFLDSLRSGK